MERRLKIVGFMGKKNSGKDTCADYLVSRFGYIKRSYADPLKGALRELFGFTEAQLYGVHEEKEAPDSRWYGCSPRKAMQFVGTDLLRNQLGQLIPQLGNEFFIRRMDLWLQERIAALQDETNIYAYHAVVIPDCRFENEVKLIQSYGGYVIKINRPFQGSEDSHASEKALESCDCWDTAIENDGSLVDLYDKLYSMNF